jgi:hypothetical protein
LDNELNSDIDIKKVLEISAGQLLQGCPCASRSIGQGRAGRCGSWRAARTGPWLFTMYRPAPSCMPQRCTPRQVRGRLFNITDMIVTGGVWLDPYPCFGERKCTSGRNRLDAGEERV